MQIDILTLFPDIFKNTLEYSIIKKACEKGIVKIKIHNIRDYTYDKHKLRMIVLMVEEKAWFLSLNLFLKLFLVC